MEGTEREKERQKENQDFFYEGGKESERKTWAEEEACLEMLRSC